MPQRSKSASIRSRSFGSFNSSRAAVAIFVGHFDCGLIGRERLADLLVLQLFELQQHAAEVALERFFFDVQLFGGLLGEGGALARRVEIQRVDVEGVAARKPARSLSAARG
jgi:hypothetical protein